ncbi:MAG: hypothetical protein ABI479_10285, partial [Gallionella sp.]
SLLGAGSIRDNTISVVWLTQDSDVVAGVDSRKGKASDTRGNSQIITAIVAQYETVAGKTGGGSADDI